MAFQTGQNIAVAFSREPTFGTRASSTAANNFRPNAGGGLNLIKGLINPNEVRRDGMSPMARHGARLVRGSLSGDLSVGTYDDAFEGVLRGQFTSTVVQGTSLNVVSVASSSGGNIVSGSTSSGFIDIGLRVGDIIRLGGNTAAIPSTDKDVNRRVTSVGSSVMTVYPHPSSWAATSSFTVTRIGRKLTQPATPLSTLNQFTIEEQHLDIDWSEIFVGCRLSTMRVQLTPNGMAVVTFDVLGKDQEIESGASAPHWPSSVVATTSTIGLVAVDSSIRLGSTVITDFTSADFTIDLRAQGADVIGSLTTPDIFLNNAQVSGSFSGLRQDLTRLQNFIDEDELVLSILLEEPGTTTPKGFISMQISRIKLTGNTKQLGSEGAMVETVPFVAGKKENTTGFDDTMVVIQTST